METEKLYYQDVYMTRFEATVLECRERKGGWVIVLDKTCFYPEGGGQPGDTGTLNDIPVTDTHEKDGIILHYTAAPIEPGTPVTGTIHWEHRFDLMQQHSGEHIVSGLIHAKFGYENVGFHMGADMITIDLSGMLTEEDMAEIEAAANLYVWENHPVKIYYPTPEALSVLPYRSKKELTGQVRIVEFPGADICACCGTHVAYTGEIGLIKLLTVQKFHSGVRIEMLCGKRAYDYVNQVLAQNRQISQLLSAKVKETAKAVKAMSTELEGKKQQLYAMEEAQFAAKAQELTGKGDVVVSMPNLSPDGVRRAAIAIQETCGGRCAVFSGDDENGYRYAVGLPNGDLRTWVKELNSALNGRGGGKPNFVQGSVTAKWDEIVAFMSR